MSMPTTSALSKLEHDALLLVSACLEYIGGFEEREGCSVARRRLSIPDHCDAIPLCRVKQADDDDDEDASDFRGLRLDDRVLKDKPSLQPLLTQLSPHSFTGLFTFVEQQLDENCVTIPNGYYAGHRIQLEPQNTYSPEFVWLSAVLNPVIPQSLPQSTVHSLFGRQSADTAPSSSSPAVPADGALQLGAGNEAVRPGVTNHDATSSVSTLEADTIAVVKELVRACEISIRDRTAAYSHVLQPDGTVLFKCCCAITRAKSPLSSDDMHSGETRAPEEYFFDSDSYRITGPLSLLVAPLSFQFLFSHIIKSLAHSPPVILRKGDFKGYTFTVQPLIASDDETFRLHCTLHPPLTKIAI